jgi:hypothetical protein
MTQFRELKTGSFRSATTGRFIPNPIGIAAIAVGPQMQGMLLIEAERIADAAKELARSEAYATGDYYRGIRASAGLDGGKAAGRINAFDWKSGFVEFGTIKLQPARHILTRAAEALGYAVTAGLNTRRLEGTGRERVTKLKGR